MSLLSISAIHAREVLDSRGKPTVEAEVTLASGAMGRAIVPSGASTGLAEARELRDGDLSRYDGQGVLQAVRNIREVLAPALFGKNADDQSQIDAHLIELDGTPPKSRLGGNSLLAVSLATAHAAAAGKAVPLYRHLHDLMERQRQASSQASLPCRIPVPMTNMISGGKHAGGNLDFQDILVIPSGAKCYSEGLEWIVRIYRRLSTLLTQKGYEGYLVGDEGGFGPRLKSNQEAVELVVQAIEQAQLAPGRQVTLAIDVASSHFYRDGSYHLAAEKGARLTASDMIDRLENWVDQFPIVSIEDGLAENDWAGWQLLTKRLGHRVRLVGDDLFATNPLRIQQGIDLTAANSVLIKVNQIGTLTETLTALQLAQQHQLGTVVSARSGETEDDTIADLAVASAADFIKIGSIVRSERLAKYNRLLRIAEQIPQ